MARTLLDFRIDKGLYIKDIAEKTGISKEELMAIEQSGTIPPDIAEILINDYCLTDTYFTVEERGKLTPENPAKYFLKVSIVYYLLIALVESIPMFVGFVETFINTFSGTDNLSITDSPIYTLFVSAWSIAVSFISCILFANHILKNTTLKGDIKKYQYLHYSIPSGMIAFLSMITACITTFSFDQTKGEVRESYLLWQLINGIISWIAIGLTIAIHVKLLKTAVEQDGEKKQKTLKTFAIIVTVSSVLAFVLTIISQILLSEFVLLVVVRRIFVYGLYIAVAWSVALIDPNDEKKCKLAYTILPLVSIFQPIIFTIIGLFI
ncbi:MAG: helix-turn-helix transcriptional regulator [Clostridia bacterium]|nr:helix-turn-helix transcriptional regulator [Clostridia bacterium]